MLQAGPMKERHDIVQPPPPPTSQYTAVTVHIHRLLSYRIVQLSYIALAGRGGGVH